MNTISMNVNNERNLKLIQRRHDGATLIQVTDANGSLETIPDSEAFISAGEMVMLINYYRNCKSGKETSDYILPAKR